MLFSLINAYNTYKHLDMYYLEMVQLCFFLNWGQQNM